MSFTKSNDIIPVSTHRSVSRNRTLFSWEGCSKAEQAGSPGLPIPGGRAHTKESYFLNQKEESVHNLHFLYISTCFEVRILTVNTLRVKSSYYI